MSNPLSMFHEKQADGTNPWSMTRVVAFMFAWGVLYAQTLYARKGVPINMPFTIIACVTVLAVPLQGLVNTIRAYLDSKDGRELMKTAMHKIEDMMGASTAAPAPAQPQTVNVSASVGPAPDNKG
jgi:hypothetical protein